jgi:aldehyde:ferredoxin oxidoreductase
MAATVAAKKVLADHAVTGQGLPKYGTQVLMNVINENGRAADAQRREVQFEGRAQDFGEAMHEKRATDGKANLVTNRPASAAPSPAAAFRRSTNHFSVVNQPQVLGRQRVASNTRTPGRWAPPTASTTSMR